MHHYSRKNYLTINYGGAIMKYRRSDIISVMGYYPRRSKTVNKSARRVEYGCGEYKPKAERAESKTEIINQNKEEKIK